MGSGADVPATPVPSEGEPVPEPTTDHHFRPVSEEGPPPDPSSVSLAIIGAGPAGIAAGVRAAERGIEHALYERSVLADTIVKYQKGKFVMAEPPQLPLQADLKMIFEEAVREQVLEWWETAVRDAGTNLVEATEILSIEGEKQPWADPVPEETWKPEDTLKGTGPGEDPKMSYGSVSTDAGIIERGLHRC